MKGRAHDPARVDLGKRYRLNERQRRRLTPELIAQLERCQSEEARRILVLGTDGRGKFKRASKNLKTKKGNE
jgi:hypothetical protein